jgi:hypothetical protein
VACRIERIKALLRIASFDLHPTYCQKPDQVLPASFKYILITGARFVPVPSFFVETSEGGLHVQVIGKTLSQIFVVDDCLLIVFRDSRQTGLDEVSLRRGKVLAQIQGTPRSLLGICIVS